MHATHNGTLTSEVNAAFLSNFQTAERASPRKVFDDERAVNLTQQRLILICRWHATLPIFLTKFTHLQELDRSLDPRLRSRNLKNRVELHFLHFLFFFSSLLRFLSRRI